MKKLSLKYPKAPRQLVFLLYSTVTLFYVSNVFSGAISSQLNKLKWISLFLLFVFCARHIKRRSLTNSKYIIAFLLVALLSTLLLGFFYSADISTSAFLIISISLMFSTSLFLSVTLNRLDIERLFFDLIANVGRFVIVSSLLMWLLNLNLGRGEGRFSGWVDNPNTLALMIVPTLVILFAKTLDNEKSKLSYNSFFLLSGLFIVLQTDSRAAMLWITTSILAFWVFHRGLKLATLLVFFVIILVFGWFDEISTIIVDLISRGDKFSDPNTALFSGRDEVWVLGIELFKQSPYIGYGLGSSKVLILQHDWMLKDFQGGHFHNSYISVLVEGGLLSLIILSAVLILVVSRGVSKKQRVFAHQRGGWATQALPWVLIVGAMAHAIFETWLISAGNANALLFWTCVWMVQRNTKLRVESTVYPYSTRIT